MGFEIRENWNLLKSKGMDAKYKWPHTFSLIAFGFFGIFIGARCFRFLINPPIALY